MAFRHNGLAIDDVKWMAEFSSVADTRHLSQILAIGLEEVDELAGALMNEAIAHSSNRSPFHLRVTLPEFRRKSPNYFADDFKVADNRRFRA